MTDQSTPKQENPFDAFVDHQRKAIEEAGKAIESLIPPDFKTHSRAAVKESIEGFRVLVNATLDTIKEELDKDEKSGGSTGANKVKVEVS